MSRSSSGYVAYDQAVAITPSDTTALAQPVSRLIVGAAGTVKVDTGTRTSGVLTTVTITMAAGIPLDLHVLKVYSTGTTATGIVGLW